MPPKKKAAAALPLAGYSIATSGTFAGTTQAVVHNTITTLGGTVEKSITQDTNVLISTPTDVKKNSKKVQDAQANDLDIVAIDWLNECSSQKKLVDTNLYLLATNSTAAANGNANGNAKGKGKKRAASPSPAPAAPPPKAAKLGPVAPKLQPKIGEGSVFKSRNVNIPLDEGCPLQNYKIYIDDDGVVHDALLNQSNASNNNNKFYRLQLVCDAAGRDFRTWTRWGRVGNHGQKALLGNGSLDDAVHNWEAKFKDKSGLTWAKRGDNPKKGKYAYVERSYENDSEGEADDADGSDTRGASPAKSTLETPIQSLMQLIFNTDYMNQAMAAQNYDAKKMPLGKLSKATINRGFDTLKQLAAAINTATASAGDIEDLSNLYYSLIPHAFGTSRPPIINSPASLKQELDLLDSLGDMKQATELMRKGLASGEKVHALDRQFVSLGLEEMTVLNPNDLEFQELSSYLINTKGSTHSVKYQVEDIFRIERNGEFDRFDKSPFAKIKSDRRLLWHGSRATNFAGILSEGLRIAPPAAPVSGYMFGKGIYLADMSSKSANYCCAYNSGGHALLLLCEAELGQPMLELTNASYNAGEDAQKNGRYSTWGKGSTAPPKWKDAGSVHPSLKGVKIPDTRTPPTNTNVPGAYLAYNEYIVYDIAQVRLRYLFRVRM